MPAFQEIARKFKLDFGLPMPEEERIEMQINDEHTIIIEPSIDGHTLALYAPVIAIPDEPSLELYSLLLESNLFGQNTDRAILSIDKGSKQVILFEWFDTHHKEYAQLVMRLEQFVLALESWKERLKNFKVGKTTKAKGISQGFRV